MKKKNRELTEPTSPLSTTNTTRTRRTAVKAPDSRGPVSADITPQPELADNLRHPRVILAYGTHKGIQTRSPFSPDTSQDRKAPGGVTGRGTHKSSNTCTPEDSEGTQFNDGHQNRHFHAYSPLHNVEVKPVLRRYDLRTRIKPLRNRLDTPSSSKVFITSRLPPLGPEVCNADLYDQLHRVRFGASASIKAGPSNRSCVSASRKKFKNVNPLDPPSDSTGTSNTATSDCSSPPPENSEPERASGVTSSECNHLRKTSNFGHSEQHT